MHKLNIITDPSFLSRLNGYPSGVKSQMMALRDLVHDTAKATPEIDQLEETLKWNEPSFITPIGSTLRMDWKEKTPDQYQLYFQCSTRLVETFRLIYGDLFKYENNRAIILDLNQEIPESELKQCIRATLTYHTAKKQIHLGIS